MADNTRTLSILIADVREAAGIEDLTDLHPDATLIKWINKSWRLFRTKMSNAGFTFFITTTTPAALPTTPASTGEQYMEIDFPAGAVAVFGIDVNVGTEWYPMTPGSFATRRDYQGSLIGRTVPHTYIVRTMAVESTTTVTVGKIMLLPVTSQAALYRIWHLPVWADITNTSYVFYGHDAWFEWLVNDVVERVAQKDDDSDNTYKIATLRKAEAWETIKRAVSNINLNQPIQRTRITRRRRA